MAAIKELLSALMLITGFIANAQKPGWQNLDLAQDQLFGISMAKAYQTLIGNKKPVSVTVAVIDAGAVDIDHPDLKKNIWVNSKEIPGNGIDDDHNGYTDDVYGWDFDGSEKNEAVIKGMTVRDKVFYDSLSYGFIPEEYRGKYSVYRKMLEDYKQQQQIATRTLDELKTFARSLDTLTSRMNKSLSPAYSDFRQYLPKNEEEKELQKKILSALKNDSDYPHFREKKLKDLLAYFQEQSIDRFEQQAGARPNVKEFYKTVALVREWLDLDHLSEPYASHGTHIAGIIGAVRNNGIGIDGIADNVKLMPLHVSSGVYGWEEAISAAIRYAADNGALVINMSINLDYTGNEAKKQAIEQAILYAVSKNILIIHAAGNEKRNIENSRPDYADAWIEAGASGPYDDSTLSAPFSNYGKTAVDVFAPGVNIYSSINGSQYETHSGTSMAAPVVAGLAALIREYYPKLTAKQVKGIIMKSVVKRDILSNKCSSGGVVNAYNALKLASAYKGLND